MEDGAARYHRELRLGQVGRANGTIPLPYRARLKGRRCCLSVHVVLLPATHSSSTVAVQELAREFEGARAAASWRRRWR